MTTRKNKPIKRKTKIKTKKSKTKRKTKKSKTKRKNAPNKLEPITELGRGLEGMINKLIDPISYAPTINKELISLKSINREDIPDCNNELAFQLKEPLQIGETNKSLGYKCYPYTSTEAKDIMLKNLAANKHLDVSKIVPPKQILGNCWFNTFFVTFFVSDKGRKFFHFFRQLMIEGKRSDGTSLKPGLKKTFAFFNLAIEASTNPNLNILDSFDTNTIIQNIYKNIPESFRKNNQLKGYYIKNVGQAGNPVNYYVAITNFLVTKGVKYLNLELLSKTSVLGKDGLKKGTRSIKNTIYYHIKSSFNRKNIMPEVIMVGVIDEVSSEYPNDNTTLEFNNVNYVLDSAIVRDKKALHF